MTKNNDGYAKELVQEYIHSNYPYDKLDLFNSPDSGLEKVKYSELCKYKGKGLPVGSEYINGELTYYLREYQHTMVHGLTGSGKTTCFYDNFIRCTSQFHDDCKPSIVLFDFKREGFKHHQKHLLANKYVTKLFDCVDPMHSNTMNILKKYVLLYIEGQSMSNLEEREIKLIGVDQFIGNLCLSICPTPPEVKDPQWSIGAREYIKALFYVLFDLAAKKIISTDDVTIENVVSLHKAVRMYWSVAKSRTSQGEVLSLHAIAKAPPFKVLGDTFLQSEYASSLLTVLGCGNITGSSYMATIEPALSNICDQSSAILTRSGIAETNIDFEELVERPTFLCIVPNSTSASTNMISLIFDALFDFVRKKTSHGPLKRPLHILLDEICNIKGIENLATFISTTRSMNVFFHLGVQSDSALSARYGNYNAINLINNVTEFFFGSQEKRTIDRFVSQGGETTTVDINYELGLSDRILFQTHSVISSSDITTMPLGTFFVRQPRHMLLKSQMIPVFAVKEFKDYMNDGELDMPETQFISKKIDFNNLVGNNDNISYGFCDNDQEKITLERRRKLMERIRKMSIGDDDDDS